MIETYDNGELEHGPRRIYNDPERIDIRGRPEQIHSEHLERTRDLIENHNPTISWTGAVYEAKAPAIT